MVAAPATADGEPLRSELRLLFVAFAALAFGAFVLLFVLSKQTEDWFSWTIQPPLTAAFLGASYLAACLLFAWTARWGDWRSAQAALLPAFVIAVLLGIATIIHEDRFHDDLFGWFWKTAYVVAPVAVIGCVVRQLRRRSAAPCPRTPLPPAMRAALVLQGAAMLAIGVLLFAAPGDASAIWPWDLTPLTARAIGAFVAGFGISALHAVVADDSRSFEGAALAYAALGAMELAALARHADDLTGSSADTWLYAGFLVSILLTGISGRRQARGLNAVV